MSASAFEVGDRAGNLEDTVKVLSIIYQILLKIYYVYSIFYISLQRKNKKEEYGNNYQKEKH